MTQLAKPTTLLAPVLPQVPLARAIGEVRPQERVAVSGTIGVTAALSISGCRVYRCTLFDETGELDLLFLGQIEIAGLEKGKHCSAVGTAAARDDRKVIWNPRYVLEPDSQG
jgi:hypothetical protein